MTTQLVRDTIRTFTKQGLDPTQMYWFDATGCFTEEISIAKEVFQINRPPFPFCVICWQGKNENVDLHAWASVKGTNPEEGIVIRMFRKMPSEQVVYFTPLMYYVKDDQVRYNAVDKNKTINNEDAEMILSFIGSWYESLSKRKEAYIPSVQKTFTNKRRLAKGKLPIYEWRTVTIEPVEPRKSHKGGTHASPRLHDRRGHLRKLKNGKNVWVKPCKVGNASQGTVFHDYRISEAA